MLHENGNIIITPMFKRMIPDKSNGKKEKSYSIETTDYRKISSSAVNLWNRRKNKIVFFTLTFPFDANEKQASESFSKFIENLTLNYGLNNYIGTKERGEEGNKLHFHVLLDLPYKDVRVFNKAWCSTFKNYHSFVPNALQLPKRRNGGAVVTSQERCVKYICKYVSKSRGQRFKRKCYFISREVLSKPRELTRNEVSILQDSIENIEINREYFKVIMLKNAYFSKFDKVGTEKKHKISI
jgi:hypothetical protein